MNVKKNILKSCYIPDQFIFIYLLFTCIYHKTSGYFILKFSTAFNNIRHFKLELQTKGDSELSSLFGQTLTYCNECNNTHAVGAHQLVR